MISKYQTVSAGHHRCKLLGERCWAAWTRSTWWPEGSRPVQSAKQRSKGGVGNRRDQGPIRTNKDPELAATNLYAPWLGNAKRKDMDLL